MTSPKHKFIPPVETHEEKTTQCRTNAGAGPVEASRIAIPEGGFFQGKVKQGRSGPIFPRTPACYRFSIVAKVVPGHEEAFSDIAGRWKRRSPSNRTLLRAELH